MTETHKGCGGAVELEHEAYKCRACGAQPVSVFDTELEALCPDHWHCDPDLAAHKCWHLTRTKPCPTCGSEPAPNTAWQAAGRLVSLASLGGAAGERVQQIVAAALVWSAAIEAVKVTDDAAYAAIGASRRVFDRAKAEYNYAVAAENAARVELFTLAKSLSELTGHKEQGK